jgi:hypothetical protein
MVRQYEYQPCIPTRGTKVPAGQKHHVPIRGQAPTIEGSRDFSWRERLETTMAESYHRSWRAWPSRLKVMELASQPNPTPHQHFSPRSPASQAPPG